jgi:DNA-binding CsgD family transcriptional regulator/tetratricopeptide (TPR) repeat protein
MRAALTWGKMEIGQREAALRLAAALRIFWWRRGHVREGCQHLDELLQGSEQCGGVGGVAARARGFQTAGFLRIRQGAPVVARRYLEDALGLARQLGDKRLIGTVLIPLGQAAFQDGNPDAARPLYEEALRLAGEVGGWMHWHILYMLLGEVAEAEGVPHQAAALYQQGLDFGRDHGDTHFTGLVLHALGNFAHAQGNLTAARAYLKESLLTLRGVAAGSDLEVAGVLSSVAGLAVTGSHPERALRLAGGVQELLRAQDAALRPSDQARLERQLESAKQALDEATARGAWVEGEDRSLDELVTYALGALEQPAPSEAHGPLPSALPQAESHQQLFRLTPRELEVADLLARGLTNRDIAGELVISAGTAEVHVKHILAKLGFTSRSQITAWAIRERTLDGPRPTIPTPRAR